MVIYDISYREPFKSTRTFTTGLPNFYDIFSELGDMPLVMAIDPGSLSMGLVIASMENGSVYYIANYKRNSTDSDRAEIFTHRVNTLLTRLLDVLNIKVVVLENQFIKFKTSNRVLMSFSDSIKTLIINRGIQLIHVYPKEWQPLFLEEYAKFQGLNLNKIDKGIIHRRASELLPVFHTFGQTDASDAYGLLYYYFTLCKISDNLTKVNERMKVSYKHSFTKYSGYFGDGSKANEMITELRKALCRSTHMIELTEELSIEENIRALTGLSNKIFFSVIKPTLRFMEEFYRLADGTMQINENTLLYLIFFRDEYDEKLI